MSLPAASAPVAVLVLAWDETAPAARVLVEATETPALALDSVAVLIPAGPATDALTQEEFLPLEASIELPAPEPLPEPPAEVPAALPPADSATANPLPEVVPFAALESRAYPLPSTEAVATTAIALSKPALVWKEVRVLNFGESSAGALADYSGPARPGLRGRGVPTLPAAPYLGSSEPALITPVAGAASSPARVAATGAVASAVVALRTLALPGSGPLLPQGEIPVSNLTPAYPTDELPAAPDAEPDSTPAPAAHEPVPTAEASTTELSEEAAEPTEPFAVDVSPVQTAEQGRPTALPAAEATAAKTEFVVPAAEAATPPDLVALRPAARPYDAPNLNFQIIQYARRAVPQALAEQPFAVLYAPAWPTWLAAQELRQRTGQPLVLHIAQLAAPEHEPLDLATGWVAELQRQALHRADLILTETAALAQRLRHELALPAHRVRPVPAADAAAVAQALHTAQRQ